MLFLPRRHSDPLRVLLILVLATSAVYYACVSIHWPLMTDSPVMHYVTFLMDHGLKPYQDISDNNMPGSYLTESWAMHLFGTGDLAWRIYDFFLLVVLTLALIVIALPWDWLAGLYAGGLFLLLHASEGPGYAVEREQVLTVLVMVAYAFLFTAVRRRIPWLLLPFALASGLAASIKPTFAPLTFILLLLTAVVLHRRKLPLLPYALSALTGLLAVAVLELAFLLHHHALHAFLFVLRFVTPAYLAMNNPTWAGMLRRSFPSTLLLLVPFALAAAAFNPRWNWERWAIAAGAVFGAFSFFVQRKGFYHHRYMLLTCILLLIAIELMTALKHAGWPRRIASVALALTILGIIPRYLWVLHGQPSNSPLTLALEDDLQHLGRNDLQRQVVCLDLVYGCLNALYHLGLVENTGFTGDLLFFAPRDSAPRQFYRAMFWDRTRQDPATVFVVSNQWFGLPNSFDKLNAWPDFAAYLQANYTEVRDRSFPGESGSHAMLTRDKQPVAYRIYIRNDSPLLGQAKLLRWNTPTLSAQAARSQTEYPNP